MLATGIFSTSLSLSPLSLLIDKLFICIVIVQVHMRGEVFQGDFVKWLDNSHAQLSGLTQNKILKNIEKKTKANKTNNYNNWLMVVVIGD